MKPPIRRKDIAPVDIRLNTLSHVLANRMHNDLSFNIGSRLTVLVEAQSTPNGNMAVRMLLYLALLYHRTIPKEVRYKESTYPLPQPRFYVLYDGKKKLPKRTFLQKLSDAYQEKIPKGAPSLDLSVRWFDITSPRVRLCQRCITLQQYSKFLQKLRDNQQRYADYSEAVHQTIRDCIAQDILKKYLLAHEKEVFTMFDEEWDYDTAVRVAAEEAAEKATEKAAKEFTEKTRLENIRSLMHSLNLTAQQAMDALHIPDAVRPRLSSLL